MRVKSAAWSQLEASLHAEYQKASDSSSSQKAAIANLKRRTREMTTEKNTTTATGAEAARNPDTAAAKKGPLVTYGGKLREKIAMYAHNQLESGVVASKLAMSIAEQRHVRNDRLAHRRIQLHIIAAGAAGVVAAKAATKAYDQLRDRHDKSQGDLRSVTSAQDDLREKLATELAAHKDSSTRADAEYKALGSSYSEALRFIEETRDALRLEHGEKRISASERLVLASRTEAQRKQFREIALQGAKSWTNPETTTTSGGFAPGKFISTRYDAESVALPKLSTSRIHKETMLPGEDYTSPHPVILTASAYERTLPMVKASLILRGVDHDDSIMLQVEL
ncbi:hypothetical protein V501_01408 [Pseudogymnoascus sp. VKM F-4519 (FW-2642)]|nr:hypothetical protein V501_01408 [Pseudogymnoascus sp. VKM F-4519 (FW-2642)]